MTGVQTCALPIYPFKTGPNGKPIISLVTCVAYGEPSRYVLYGELVNTKPYTEEAFDAAE